MGSRIAAFCTTAALAAGLVALLPSGPASAGVGTGGDDTDSGYSVGAVQVTVEGHVSSSKRATVSLPAPLCWWEPLTWPDVDPSDPEAVEKAWQAMLPYLTGHAAEGQLSVFRDRFEQAIKAKKNGQDVTWYSLQWDSSQLPAGDGYQTAAALHAAGCGSGTQQGRGGPILVTLDFFPAGNPPAPVVQPEALAEYAYEVMDLVSPALAWNPRMTQVNGATLVNLPTWLWVTDPASVGTRSVTATAGQVSATVTARTDGVSITSPAGTTECDTRAARTAYAPGVAESSACTLTFMRASRGYGKGFPVQAQSTWQAEWTSNVGRSGTLEAKSTGATTNIPVAESQTLVKNAR